MASEVRLVSGERIAVIGDMGVARGEDRLCGGVEGAGLEIGVKVLLAGAFSGERK